MKPFPPSLTSRAVPLLVDNVDTDTIIPSREMRTTGRDGLADGLFAPWRYSDADTRTENPEFVLNQPEYRGATILLGGDNFGCGSSREHAVWALAEYGIRAIIAAGFAPIFKANCQRNGILPITLPKEVIATMKGVEIVIIIGTQTIIVDGVSHGFDINNEAKLMLVKGLDAIDLTLTQDAAIADWIKTDRAARPWIYLEHSA